MCARSEGPFTFRKTAPQTAGEGRSDLASGVERVDTSGRAIDRVHRLDAESCVVCPQGAAANEKAGTGCSLQFYRAPRSLFLLLLTLAEAAFSHSCTLTGTRFSVAVLGKHNKGSSDAGEGA